MFSIVKLFEKCCFCYFIGDETFFLIEKVVVSEMREKEKMQVKRITNPL